jgi:ribosome recycling factor
MTSPPFAPGRANPGMFSRIVIDYYGSPTPITQMCSINVPEARMVVIKPYEAGQLKPIEEAIRNSDLGVNPTNDGSIIRVSIPQLTEERRRDLVKQAKSKGEDAKVSVRNIRRKAMEELAPHQEGRRRRRGRGRPRGKGSRQGDATTTSPRSMNSSSTRKASCSRSE